MDTTEFLARYGSLAGTGRSRHLIGEITNKLRKRISDPAVRAKLWALEVHVDYLWYEDQIQIVFVDKRKREKLFVMTDPKSEEQLDALVFAVNLMEA